jgi:predicted P-loop ATPase
MANQVSAEQVQQELWSADPSESARTSSSNAASPKGADSAQFDSTYFDLLRDEATQLANAGVVVMPVICQQLDPKRYPQMRNGKPVLDKHGNPVPAFCGKNPSCWLPNGEPKQLSHKTPPSMPEVLQHIDTAERLSKPLGIAIVPSAKNTAIDFDAKDYAGGKEELAKDVERLLKEHPELRSTRRESTPSGGQHFYVHAVDGMESWRKANGSGHNCNFSTTEDGQHRGEVLVGTRVCVTWPTPEYNLLNLEHAHTFAEVPNLAAIGITPCSGRRKPKPKPQQAAATAPPRLPSSGGKVPQLADLLGKMAQQVLTGGRPYGSNPDDRSHQLTGFMRELYSVLNWLDGDGLSFDGNPDALIQQAVAALGIEDKADRVIEGIDRAECQLSDGRIQSLSNRYGYQSGERRRPGSRAKAAQSSRPQAGKDQQQQPASWRELIEALPDGWVVDDDGERRRQQLSVGGFADLLEKHQDRLRYNELTMFVEVLTGNSWCAVVDADMDSAYVLLSQKGWVIGVDPITKAACHVSRQQSFHPVRQYLLDLEENSSVEAFDLDQVAPRFFRSPEPLHVAMVRKWLVGAVARAMDAGCQMDYALVLQSRQQGIGKSTSFRDLASPDWFTSTVPDGDKDFLLNVHSCWIFELAELESVTGKRDAGRLKNLITSSTDMFRVPYGRTAERRKRGSVFCGTVNEDTFLRDETGNRRYWVVPIEGSEPLDRNGLKAARDGIWRAALAAWRAGELPMLSRAQEALSEIQNGQFVQADPWLAMLQAAMEAMPQRWQAPFSTADALLTANLRKCDQITKWDETRIAPLLRQLGFEKKQERQNGVQLRLWRRTAMPEPSQPSQRVTTPSGGGCDSSDPLQQIGSEQLSQPSQPIHSERTRSSVRAASGEAAGQAEPPFVGRKVVTVVTPLKDPWQDQGSAPSQPPVTTPQRGCDRRREVVTTRSWLHLVIQLREANPGALPVQLANLLQAEHGISTTGQQVREQLEAWDRQQLQEVA